MCMDEPRSTPISEDKTRAQADPANTHHIDSDFEQSSMVDNCVLSPSSARNTIKKAVAIVFHIILTPLNNLK